MTLRTVLLSLQALLATPEPDDPQDAGKRKEIDWSRLSVRWENVFPFSFSRG